MLRRAYRAIALSALLFAGCSDTPAPVTVEDGSVTLLNQTSRDWKNVVITVNDHFVGGVPLLKAKGRANAPLSQFTTGLGQRWDPGIVPRKVEVRGESAGGAPVSLLWEIAPGRTQ